MHSGEVTIDNITKIEGSAGLKVIIEDDAVKDLKFILQDYRRFYTQAVKGKPIIAAPSFLSRICGTCSVAHLFASIKALEMSQGIEVSEQTKILRRLAYDGLMIRDHALHIYFFVLPDLLGVDSILDIPDDDNDAGHILLHDSFDIKRLGTDITNVIIGAAVHAPIPTVGGFLKNPDPAKFPDLVTRLEAIRPQVLRGIKTFAEWPESLVRNSDYLYLRNDNQYDYLEGDIVSSSGRRLTSDKFLEFMQEVVIPYSQSEGYKFSDTHEDYLVGALPRVNFNKDLLHPRTKADAASYLSLFPSQNIHHNNLAQAIEILNSVDDAIDILKTFQVNADEKPVRKPPQAGTGVGVVEAPRGTLYHMAKTDDKGMIVDYDVIVPTAQNQITIENDLKKYFNDNISKTEDELHHAAEEIVRAYDPCISCSTNFLKIDWIRK
jgi:coenzyme F420-reducing hydrogenase alpha subunit